MWRFFVMFFLVGLVSGYPTRQLDIDAPPELIRANDACIVLQNTNGTVLRYHNSTVLKVDILSETMAVNHACDLVLFGHPNNNSVDLWYPDSNTIITVRAEFKIDVPVSRFGFSLDIQQNTWVVGAPGTPANRQGTGYTIGYAFVFVDQELQSCRSLYDSYCWSVDHECYSGFKQWKDYNDLTTAEAPDFQKKCTPFGTPWYITGPLEENMAYFEFQQFGYSVALTGDIDSNSTTLFISAPGDTQRFMENNDGKNYGRVYVWDIDQQEDFAWWQMSIQSPLKIPNKLEATYAAFGRHISASDTQLVISSYPFYNLPTDPFVFIYDCKPGTISNCIESPNRGIAIEDLPFNRVLSYMTLDMLTYMTPFANAEYVPSASETLGDFQNEFIGKQAAVVGSNVIIPDPINKYVYRMGIDSFRRERHSFEGQLGASTNSEHWVHDGQHNRLTHLWACPRGHVGPKDTCTPCSWSYYSPDGWLEVCDPCPVNYTTTSSGMSKCELWHPELSSGLTWDAFIIITAILSTSVLTCGGLIVACQFACVSAEPRRKRFS